jgi:hypothetical protein
MHTYIRTGYAMRKHDQDLAKACRKSDPDWAVPAEDYCTWDATEFVCSDMAGVLQTPKVATNKAFYLRKLSTFCYGLYSAQADQHSLAFWNESIAGKGSNEVLSAAHNFFIRRRTGSTHLVWCADNTGAQIKNWSGVLYKNELVRTDGFAYYKRIDMKYSPPGKQTAVICGLKAQEKNNLLRRSYVYGER